MAEILWPDLKISATGHDIPAVDFIDCDGSIKGCTDLKFARIVRLFTDSRLIKGTHSLITPM